MSTASTYVDTTQPAPARVGGGTGDGGGQGGGDGGRDAGGSGGPLPVGGIAVVGTWVALAPIAMTFLAFVSAYVVSQDLSTQWGSIEVPGLIWANTAVLVVSSVILELARAVQRQGSSARNWYLITLALGALFMVGQFVVWGQLQAQGVRMNTSGHSAFVYLLSGAHALHVLGGLGALLASAFWPAAGWRGLLPAVVGKVTAIYWHFLGVLWLGLILLIVLRR